MVRWLGLHYVAEGPGMVPGQGILHAVHMAKKIKNRKNIHTDKKTHKKIIKKN